MAGEASVAAQRLVTSSCPCITRFDQDHENRNNIETLIVLFGLAV